MEYSVNTLFWRLADVGFAQAKNRKPLYLESIGSTGINCFAPLVPVIPVTLNRDFSSRDKYINVKATNGVFGYKLNATHPQNDNIK